MSQPITSDTRTEAVKTVSNQYFFNIGGTWDGATISLQWSENGTDWYPLKDSSDTNVGRTANSNGIITTGKNGFLSALPSSTGGSTALQLSLIPT